MKAFRGFLFCILFLTFCLTRKNYFPQSIYLCSMEWLINLFVEQSALQAVIILSLITAIGLGLGKIHICGISLGVTFVFFTGTARAGTAAATRAWISAPPPVRPFTLRQAVR
jgi:hypothetical protein